MEINTYSQITHKRKHASGCECVLQIFADADDMNDKKRRFVTRLPKLCKQMEIELSY